MQHTCATRINLKKCLTNDPVVRPRPLNFHERTCHILPNQSNTIQFTLDDLQCFTEDNQMIINKSKTNLMLFNKSRNFDFPPEVQLRNTANYLDVIEKTKLLGIQLTTDLKWSEQTIYISKRQIREYGCCVE